MITILHLGTVRQNQDAEKRLLCRKSERRGWRKREGVWRKNDICGENVKNAGEKKYHPERPDSAVAEKTVDFFAPAEVLRLKYRFEIAGAFLSNRWHRIAVIKLFHLM